MTERKRKKTGKKGEIIRKSGSNKDEFLIQRKKSMENQSPAQEITQLMPDNILFLQGVIGNQAVNELMEESKPEHTPGEDVVQGVFTYKGKKYDKDNAHLFKKTFYKVSKNDIQDLAKSKRDFGTLRNRQDFVDAIEEMNDIPLPEEETTTYDKYQFGDKTQVLIRDKTNNLVIGLDPHQNKHQHPKSRIPELGPWKYKSGTKFAYGKGLTWHRDNTAKTMQKWAIKQLPIGPTDKVILPKKPLSDEYIYDAALFMDQGVNVLTYHCNPQSDE
jgi:hypothetical protein